MISDSIADNKIKILPGSIIWANQTDRSQTLERRTQIFFEISAAIELTTVEQRILLDVTSREMAQLRRRPASAFRLGGAKLERRVNYAVPILQRMVAAMCS